MPRNTPGTPLKPAWYLLRPPETSLLPSTSDSWEMRSHAKSYKVISRTLRSSVYLEPRPTFSCRSRNETSWSSGARTVTSCQWVLVVEPKKGLHRQGCCCGGTSTQSEVISPLPPSELHVWISSEILYEIHWKISPGSYQRINLENNLRIFSEVPMIPLKIPPDISSENDWWEFGFVNRFGSQQISRTTA